MELFSVKLRGYKRFAEETILRTNGKAIALIGPNEVGKSSLLNAIASLPRENVYKNTDISRDTQEADFQLQWRFLLSGGECEEASIPYPSWLIVVKTYDDRIRYNIEPRMRERDTLARERAISKAVSLIEEDGFADDVIEQLPDEFLINF